MHPQPPHANRSPPPASDLQERPSPSTFWTGQSRSQARGRVILGASLSTSFIGPAGQPFWRAVNRSTTQPFPFQHAARTRTTRGASPSRYVPSSVFVHDCFPASLLPSLRSPSPRVLLYWHLPSPSAAAWSTISFLGSIRNHQPPSPPCLPNKLFSQSTCTILRALIPVAPGSPGPSQLGCGCHHPVNHHPLAARHPKPALSQSNLSTPRLFCTAPHRRQGRTREDSFFTPNYRLPRVT